VAGENKVSAEVLRVDVALFAQGSVKRRANLREEQGKTKQKGRINPGETDRNPLKGEEVTLTVYARVVLQG